MELVDNMVDRYENLVDIMKYCKQHPLCNINLGSASEDAALNASLEHLGILPAFQPRA